MSLSCRGDDLDISATGTVAWQGSIRSAALDLRWQVRSQNLYRQEVNFLGALVGQEPNDDGALSFRLYGPWQRLRTLNYLKSGRRNRLIVVVKMLAGNRRSLLLVRRETWPNV